MVPESGSFDLKCLNCGEVLELFGTAGFPFGVPAMVDESPQDGNNPKRAGLSAAKLTCVTKCKMCSDLGVDREIASVCCMVCVSSGVVFSSCNSPQVNRVGNGVQLLIPQNGWIGNP